MTMEVSDLLSLVLDSEELCRDYAPLFLAHELTTQEVLEEITVEMLGQIGITNRHHAEHIIQARNRVFGRPNESSVQPASLPASSLPSTTPITLSLLTRCSPASQKSLTKVTPAELRSLTHLVLSSKGITHIDNLHHCPQAQHLYLYENQITVIENLDSLKRLKVLYLQGNRIRRIEGLEELTMLVRLDVSENEIEVLEGLETLGQLQELACNRQRIGGGMRISEESIVGISRSLVRLGLVGNRIEDVSVLWYLDAVEDVDLTDNNIDFTEGLTKMLTCMRSLQRLVMKGNPVTRIPKYRDEIIMRNSAVRELDGKDILANEREYLYRLKHHKAKPTPTAPAPRTYHPQPIRFKGAGKPKGTLPPPVLEVTGRKP